MLSGYYGGWDQRLRQNKMTEKRLKWRRDKKETTGKNIHVAYNGSLDDLGYLEYERTGAFMHWCWYQFEDIRMSPGCLQEVRDKQKELSRKSKDVKE